MSLMRNIVFHWPLRRFFFAGQLLQCYLENMERTLPQFSVLTRSQGNFRRAFARHNPLVLDALTLYSYLSIELRA